MTNYVAGPQQYKKRPAMVCIPSTMVLVSTDTFVPEDGHGVNVMLDSYMCDPGVDMSKREKKEERRKGVHIDFRKRECSGKSLRRQPRLLPNKQQASPQSQLLR